MPTGIYKRTKEMYDSRRGRTPWNKDKKGLQVAWNKDTKGVMKPNSGNFKKNQVAWNKDMKIQTNTGRTHFKKGQASWNKGKIGVMPIPWNKDKKPSKETLMVLAQGRLKQANMKGPTSIEKKVYDELKARGILFETQKLIKGKFVVDAYIPSLNLVIEADGDYWHSLPENIKRDKAKNAYLTKCGFNLLRFSGTEIRNDSFKEMLDERSVS